MLPASPLFKDALRYSHRALTRAWLMEPGPVSGFVDKYELSVSQGSLRLNGTRNVWRTGQLSVVALEAVDRGELASINSTYRVRVERGIRFPDGSEEWVQVALGQVQDVDVTLSAAEVTLTFSDLGALVEDYKLTLPYAPRDEAGELLTTVAAIQELVESAIVWDVIPGWNIDPVIDQLAKPTESTVFTGSRWAAVQSLAESIAAVVYQSPDGWWNIRSAAADVNNPVARMEAGKDGVLIDLTRSRKRVDQYNAIPLNWESPGIGGLVFIVDADSSSPTFWNGPFGRKPRDEESNDLITSEQQAIDAATALLDQYRGLTASLRFESVHDPLLEPLDVVELSTKLGTEIHIIDSIDYPLVGGKMVCQTRLLREVTVNAVI
jgi:hypothetical protein